MRALIRTERALIVPSFFPWSPLLSECMPRYKSHSACWFGMEECLPRVHSSILYRCCCTNVYGLQVPLLLGLVHSGPRLVVASGTLIMATGPALCSPLNGVGWVGSKPHFLAELGLLNQKPTWKVLSGAKLASGSKPKI